MYHILHCQLASNSQQCGNVIENVGCIFLYAPSHHRYTNHGVSISMFT